MQVDYFTKAILIVIAALLAWQALGRDTQQAVHASSFHPWRVVQVSPNGYLADEFGRLIHENVVGFSCTSTQCIAILDE